MDDHYRKLERLYLVAPTNQYYRPSIRIDEAEAEITVPVRRDFYHAADAVHGSVYFKVMDDAAFFACNSLVTDVLLLTVSYTVHFVRPVSEGEIRAEGRVVHASRRLYVSRSTLTDSDGRTIGTGSGTFMRSRIELGPDLGYA